MVEAVYNIVVVGLLAFGVEVTSPRGFRSVRGFASELEAEAWIAEQKMAAAAADAIKTALEF